LTWIGDAVSLPSIAVGRDIVGGRDDLLKHSEAMAAATCGTILAGIGILPAHAEPQRHEDFEVDRELVLAVSDGFSRQTWRYAGQVWSETRDTLLMHEDERVRVYITNDMPGVRVISFGDDEPVRRVRTGDTVAIDMTISRLAGFSIAVVGQPALSRPVRVRANSSAHAA
jgi:hypothetical protein